VVEIMVGVRDWKTYDWDILGHMGGSIAMEVPKNGWFIMEHPKQEWMIWGCPYFRKPLYWGLLICVVYGFSSRSENQENPAVVLWCKTCWYWT
jgi:hypothetical protein